MRCQPSFGHSLQATKPPPIVAGFCLSHSPHALNMELHALGRSCLLLQCPPNLCGEAKRASAPSLQVKTDGIPEAIVEELIAQSKELQAGRKQKTYVSETLATAEEVQSMALRSSHAVHKTTLVGRSPALSGTCQPEVTQHACCCPYRKWP